jgi:uncharacterized protein with ParB-like and HNH nuclease domain
MDLKSVHEIFTNRILRIPSYQRGFSWSNNKAVEVGSKEPLKNVKGQLKDLWDDIMNIPKGGWHYTGLLTLVVIEEKDYNWLPNHSQYAIVDGQQRITSILILLSVIIEKAKKLNIILGIREDDADFQYLYINQVEKAYVFGYEKDNPSDKFFKQHILKLDLISDDSEESVYTENLLKARLFFENVLEIHLKSKLESEVDTLKNLFKTVTSSLKLNEYVLPKELDEYVVFETMNNRGKPLSELEKLKNRLMYLNDKFELEVNPNLSGDIDLEKLLFAQQERLSADINKAWITIYKSLGQNKQHPLSDEFFIKNHWITYFNKYSRTEANVYSNFLFDEYFNLQNVYDKALTVSQTETYIKSLQKCSIWWNKLHYPSFFKTEESNLKETILGVHRVGLKTSFRPILLAILSRSDRELFLNSIKILEKYSFKVFDVSDRQSNSGDTKIYSLANAIYTLQKNHLQTEQDLISYTNEYYLFQLFINQIYQLFNTGDKKGFYKWSGIHYFLFEYDKYLRIHNRTSTKASELVWKDFTNKNTIEHIFPQSATLSLAEYAASRDKKEEDVKADYLKIQEDWKLFEDYDPIQRKLLANSLGNLLAISQSDNASFSNDQFIFKVDQSNKGEEYKNRGYKFDSMSAMLVASENEDWSPEKILKRGLEMLKYLCFYIGEDFLAIEENVKYRILGLEFMIPKETELQIENRY